MSGIEVIGAVLGAIPLVISGLEHYGKCVKTIKDTKHAAAEFKVVVRQLRIEELMFRNTLQILLSECFEHETLSQLLDATGQDWNSEGIQTTLKQRLQGSYLLYIEHVLSIEKTLSEFVGRLHLGPRGEVPCEATAASFRQAYKRFGFALKKSGYLDLVKEIRDANVVLERLTGQTRVLQAAGRTRKLPDSERIRVHANNIFSGLQKALQISCSEPHKVSMCLKQSVVETHTNEKAAVMPANKTFRIVLHHDLIHPKQKSLRWSVEEVEIELIEAAPPDPIASDTMVTAQSPYLMRAKGRKVKFEESKPIPGVITSILQPQNLTEIHDLCQSIDSIGAIQCGNCLGYIMAGQSRHGLYSPQTRLIDQTPLKVESLAGVLSEQNGSRLTGADARRLAVPLATAMLSLHDTPWLQNVWSKKDITLIRKDGKILSQHPFVSQDMRLQQAANASHPGGTSASTSFPSRITALLIKNQALFSLGIVLIELSMGKPIEALHEPDELNADGTKSELSEFQTAERLLRMEVISDKFGKRWSDVVRRCIHCELDEAKKSLEDLGFRKAVYNKVLVELEEDYKQFFGL